MAQQTMPRATSVGTIADPSWIGPISPPSTKASSKPLKSISINLVGSPPQLSSIGLAFLLARMPVIRSGWRRCAPMIQVTVCPLASSSSLIGRPKPAISSTSRIFMATPPFVGEAGLWLAVRDNEPPVGWSVARSRNVRCLASPVARGAVGAARGGGVRAEDRPHDAQPGEDDREEKRQTEELCDKRFHSCPP